ncbi:hypothetical protein MSM1_06320 [Mycobacterium sp. SM1]|uniref:hypothetical protein n=1 Tax=Mycobacterium sp. SM1 TaxID=2816243 RepID=UPI001BD03D7E|nr:hypothetical protein [Mycobacterium sp. SM1]MBS4727979.1 hypothetical protein [Mycobacterium sp. SM1]
MTIAYTATDIGVVAGGPSTLDVLLSLSAMLLALVFPVAFIAFVCRRAARTYGLHDHSAGPGLGEVSLHDELWRFIEEFERGEVTLASVGLDAGGRDTGTSPQAPEASTTPE